LGELALVLLVLLLLLKLAPDEVHTLYVLSECQPSAKR
jgi:hypothetical protein